MSDKKEPSPGQQAFEGLQRSLDQFFRAQGELWRQGARAYVKAVDELGGQLKTNAFLWERWVEGGALQALDALREMQRDVTGLLFSTLSGQTEVDQYVRELGERVRAGGRYGQLITTLGAELFGSARFEGEELLAEDELVTLSYLPPRPGAGEAPFALFHAGGFLPYSDRIFRALPEANLFAPFLERGVPVYAMELRGDAETLGQGLLGQVTLERIIDTIEAMSEIAFAHNQQQKMVLEGYCALGMPALSYLAALPESAGRKFTVGATMVSPIDGQKCALVGKLSQVMPEGAQLANMTLVELSGDVLSGDALRFGMDIPIGAFFPKTPFGRFAAGWKNRAYAEVETVEQLTPPQRKELAGAYWISPENCRRYPLPGDLARFSGRLWREGVKDDLQIPATYRGAPLSFRTIAEQTELRLAGFYGGKDVVIPEQTGHVLRDNLGERYTHVVHPAAGHISYVLSPGSWKPEHKYALDPNPIDVLTRLHQKGA